MKQNKVLQFLIYGYAENSFKIELPNYMHSEKQTDLINEILNNTLNYLDTMLKLNPDNVYIYIQNEFKNLKNLSIKHPGQINDNIPILVIYTDENLMNHKPMQRKILRETLNIKHDDIIEKTENIKDNSIILKSNKKLKKAKKQYVFTKDVAVKPLDNNLPNYVYAKSVLTSPFSVLKGKVVRDDKLLPPIYMDREYIDSQFNFDKNLYISPDMKLMKLNEKGELVLIDKSLIELQKSVIKEVIGKSSMMVLKGQGLSKMTFPCKVFDKKTHLQKHAEQYSNLTQIHKAIETKDHVERLKHLVCYFATKFYYVIGPKKPFNSYQGETFQGSFGDGTKIYLEHLSHDPPQDALLITNEFKGFKIYGKITTNEKLKANEVVISLDGVITVEIGTEKTYMQWNRMAISGVMLGDRKIKLKDSIYLYSPDSHLKAIAHFGTTNQNKRNDVIHGGIYKEPRNLAYIGNHLGDILFDKNSKENKQDLICELSGSWLSSLSFNGVEYWNKSQAAWRYFTQYDVLPSDWRFREDYLWTLYGDLKQADMWKAKLEDLYREDKRNRNEYRKRYLMHK